MPYVHKVSPGQKVSLADVDPGSRGGTNRPAGEAETADLLVELDLLQEELYAAGTQALLVVLQGLDTSGKDGTVRRVIGSLNPMGFEVTPFKVPSAVEAGHDFLWRVHGRTPARGLIGVFNRSHYEDVLAARVHGLVPREVWETRYDAVNDFERLLVASGTIVVKLFLHIGKKEQKKRLLERERDPAKAWKVAAGDWLERRHWDAYQVAYEDALSRCSTREAPWYIVPANHKWFRNLAIAETLVEAMRPWRRGWQESIERTRRERLEEVAALRAKGEI